MHRRAHRLALLPAVLALALGAACQSTSSSSPTGAAGGSGSSGGSEARLSSSATSRAFTLGAAGDFGATAETAKSLRALDASDAEFFLALGDFDYDMTPTDRAWCRYVKERLPRKGATYPFELVAGNHEADTGQDGRVRHFARC